MVPDDRLCDVLCRLTRSLTSDVQVEEIVDRLVEDLVDALEVDVVAATLLPEGTHPGVVAASDVRGLRLERLQRDLARGPALDARETARSVLVPDLTLEDRFAYLSRTASSDGLRAAFALPLCDGDVVIGSLSLWRAAPGPLDERQAAAARTIGEVAAAVLVDVRGRSDLLARASREHADLDRMRALARTKDEYLATVIHELRTPMTSIRGYTELLQDSDLEPEQRRLVDAVLRNSERLGAQADDLLTLLSLEHGSLGHEHAPVDLVAVVAAVRATVDPLVERRELEVVYEVPDGPVLVHGHAADLERALTNLVTNAVKYTEDPGWVHLSLRQRGRGARVEVGDSGIGIPAAEHAHLFSRFFRSSTARRRGIPGSGLGLTIVESVVHAHSGTISVDSDVGRGTRFVVELPSLRDTPGPAT